MDAQLLYAGDSVNYTPGSAVAAGDVVVQGTLVGIAANAIAASALGALQVAGVFSVPKATTSGSAIAAGAKVYWDDTNDVATETSGGNTYMGKVVTAAVDADSTVQVRLEQ